jgi:hypothetical protein
MNETQKLILQMRADCTSKDVIFKAVGGSREAMNNLIKDMVEGRVESPEGRYDGLIRRYMNAGKGQRETAELIGLSNEYVSERVKCMKQPNAFRRKAPSHDALVKAVKSGLTNVQIVKLFRVAKNTIGPTIALIRRDLNIRGVRAPAEPKEPQDEFAPVKSNDDLHVKACLAQGGFVYREVRNGRVVEVRP